MTEERRNGQGQLKDPAVGFMVLAALFGAIGFGAWQQSAGAGMFMFPVLLTAIFWSDK